MSHRSRLTQFAAAIIAVSVYAVTGLTHGVLWGQQSAQRSAPAPALKYSNLIFTVQDVDRSARFYRDVLGLDVLSSNRRPQGDAVVNPYVAKVSASPEGLVFASAILKLPGTSFNLLLTEFGSIERNAREPVLQEPGTAVLILAIRDLDQTLEAARRANVRIVSQGTIPIELSDRSRSVVLRDPDGFLVQLIQMNHATEGSATESRNVLNASVQITVPSLNTTRAFYQRALGFNLQSTSRRKADRSMQRLFGGDALEMRTVEGGLPTSTPSHRFIEFSGGTRRAAQPARRLRDPGTAAFSIGVGNVDELLSRVTSNGARVISTRGAPVVSPNGGRNIFVQDPNGFFLELEGEPGAR